MEKFGYVYIMTNKNKTVLYIGVTNNLFRRIHEHGNHLIKNSFSDKYNLEYCIYYEVFTYFNLAIQREKELKKWNRQKKEELINKKNPEWKEVANEKGFIRNRKEIPHFNNNNVGNDYDQIPHSVRNDVVAFESIEKGSGDEAAASLPLSLLWIACPSERREESAENTNRIYNPIKP